MSDIRQSAIWADFLSATSWRCDLKDHVRVYSKRIPLTPFRVVKILRPTLPFSFSELNRYVETLHPLLIKIELHTDVPSLIEPFLKEAKQLGYFVDPWRLTPPETVRVNLKTSLDSLLSAMRKNVRWGIRHSERYNLTLGRITTKEEFLSFWKETAKKHSVLKQIESDVSTWWDIFPSNRYVYGCFFRKKLVSAAYLVPHQGTLHLLYLTTNTEGRKLYATYFLIWSILKLAKKSGFSYFDFEGIDTKHVFGSRWEGLTFFKKGFGGSIRTYPPSLTKIHLPFLSLITRFVTRLRSYPH
ncbi:MAG TPA: peptidoglycan bridge formation glycyltransferase FemA/FemB family protein [Patescibacteria group bacterium]|nr:peptidoglycan bridge formation glycyltransferase FemA/FemB family protein [Patescibacteria group bacterium]